LTRNPFTRKAPSATDAANTVHEEIFNFLLNCEPDAFKSPDDFSDFLTDIEFISNSDLNEERHFAKKSTSLDRTRARKFYKKNKPKIKAMQDKIKSSKGLQKKKEILAKSDRNLKGKKKKKYNTAGHEKKHVSDARLKKGARLLVEKWFEPAHYRCIKTFTINEQITARLNEEVLYYGNDSYELVKRDGRRFKIEIKPGVIGPYIKRGVLCTEDII
jgi:hypothetical protein